MPWIIESLIRRVVELPIPDEGMPPRILAGEQLRDLLEPGGLTYEVCLAFECPVSRTLLRLSACGVDDRGVLT